ncbi:hypothetical protein RYX36_028024 [Vicia faba]
MGNSCMVASSMEWKSLKQPKSCSSSSPSSIKVFDEAAYLDHYQNKENDVLGKLRDSCDANASSMEWESLKKPKSCSSSSSSIKVFDEAAYLDHYQNKENDVLRKLRDSCDANEADEDGQEGIKFRRTSSLSIN